MEQVRIPWKSWVVVCDGAKALVFRNDGSAELPKLQLLEVSDQPEPPTRDLGSDRPGRVHQSNDVARSAVETTDWHAEAEAAFLAKLAERLDKAVQEQAAGKLVLVAPPKALGILRKHLTPAARALVTAELAKDLVRLSTAEIERHLAG